MYRPVDNFLQSRPIIIYYAKSGQQYNRQTYHNNKQAFFLAHCVQAYRAYSCAEISQLQPIISPLPVPVSIVYLTKIHYISFPVASPQ